MIHLDLSFDEQVMNRVVECVHYYYYCLITLLQHTMDFAYKSVVIVQLMVMIVAVVVVVAVVRLLFHQMMAVVVVVVVDMLVLTITLMDSMQMDGYQQEIVDQQYQKNWLDFPYLVVIQIAYVHV